MTAALAGPVSNPTEPVVSTSVYEYSSQARSWRFSPRQLEKMRSDGLDNARQRLEQMWKQERALSPVDGEPEASSSSEQIPFLSIQEEQALIDYYLTRVRQLVKAFLLPELVEATAISYIKRFYLRNTCMDYHPKNIMLTCLFLAAKAENNAIPLHHFSMKLAGKDPSQSAVQEYTKIVQGLEFLVSQSLSFEYMVTGAHRALHGLILDVQKSLAPSSDVMQQLLGPARTNVQHSRFTDAEFIYTPSQIALASLSLASTAAEELVKGYLDVKEKRALQVQRSARDKRQAWRAQQNAKKTKQQDRGASEVQDDPVSEDAPLGMRREALDNLLHEIKRMIQAREKQGTSDIEQVRAIDKKLKQCANPELDPKSRISQHRLQGREEAVLGKRSKTATSDGAENKPFVDDDDDDDDGLPDPDSRTAKRTKYTKMSEERRQE